MAKISTYQIDSAPTIADKLIGTEVDSDGLDITKNYTIGDILNLKSFATGAPVVVAAKSGGNQDVVQYGNIYTISWTGGAGFSKLNLPKAGSIPYRKIIFSADGTISATQTISLSANGTETINGASTKTINSAYASLSVWSDGTNWRIIQEIS